MTVYWKQNGVWRDSTKQPIPPRKWTLGDFNHSSTGMPHLYDVQKIKPSLRQFFVVGDSFDIVVGGLWSEKKGEFRSTPIPGLRLEHRDKEPNGTIFLVGTITQGAGSVKDALSVVSYSGDSGPPAYGDSGADCVDTSFTTSDGQHIPILEG